MKPEAPSSSRALAALGLRQPLRLLTNHRLDERGVLEIWQGIERRLHPDGLRADRLRSDRMQRWRLLRPALLGMALALSLLLAGGWGLSRLTPARSAHGPLTTAQGQRFESVEAGALRAEKVSFADGSQIEAEPGSRVEGLAATATEFVVLLRRGKARFSVTPGGPRRWLVEARGATVEVVGTVFSVESRAGVFAVRVDAGVVLVRSPLLADGVQRLSAGQTLRLDPGSEPERNPGEQAEPESAEPELDEPALVPPPATAAPSSRTRTAVKARSPKQPAQELSPDRADQRRAPDSAVELWARADEARRAGDAAAAALLLERLIDRYPRDSQAGLAAYTLGVLQLEQLAAPRAAAERFRQALELGIAAGLRESCYLRQAEALQHAGDDAAARQVARQYLRSFPLGEQRDAMQRLITGGAPLDDQDRTRGEKAR